MWPDRPAELVAAQRAVDRRHRPGGTFRRHIYQTIEPVEWRRRTVGRAGRAPWKSPGTVGSDGTVTVTVTGRYPAAMPGQALGEIAAEAWEDR